MNADSSKSLEEGHPVWPADQEVLRLDPAIAMTRFEDMLPFHGGLIDYLVGREGERRAEGAKQTGAAGGIGSAMAAAFAAHGGELILADFDAEALEVVNELGARLGGTRHEAAVSHLQQLVGDFDFEDAQTAMDRLAAELGVRAG